MMKPRRRGLSKRKGRRVRKNSLDMNFIGQWALLKQEKVEKKKKYYFAFECCDSSGNSFQLMKEKECE